MVRLMKFLKIQKSFVSNDKRYSTLNVQYNCNREIKYKTYIDGLGRNIKSENYEKTFLKILIINLKKLKI